MIRVLYFCMGGELSRAPLAALLDGGFEVAAVVVSAEAGPPIALIASPPRAGLPLLNQFVTRGPLQLAHEQGIPAFRLRSPGHPEALATLAALRPEAGCASCFDRKLPPALLALPPLGVVNLHPSLLPAYRGPAPLFWAFRDGLATTGVTAHLMDDEFDTGPLLLQAPLALPDGMNDADAEHAAAAIAARLLIEALRGLEAGTLQPQPQEGGGSHQPWPTAADFVLSTDWPARRAYNFMRGTSDWHMPYQVDAGGTSFLLRSAISFERTTVLRSPFRRRGAELLLQCSPGVLRATVEP